MKRKAPPDTSVDYKRAKTSRRASPSNQSRYPRPPAEIKTLADVVAMDRYMRAGGEVESSEDELDQHADLATDELLNLYDDLHEEPLKVRLQYD